MKQHKWPFILSSLWTLYMPKLLKCTIILLNSLYIWFAQDFYVFASFFDLLCCQTVFCILLVIKYNLRSWKPRSELSRQKKLTPGKRHLSRWKMIVWVSVVLNRAVVDCNWNFDNLSDSHLQSQSELYHMSWWLIKL